MKKYIVLGTAAAAITLAACGGKTHVSGGFTSGTEDEPPQSGIEVIVTDSRIDGAFVCIDLDGSGSCSESDPAGFTDKDGKVFIGVDKNRLGNAESYLVLAEASHGDVMRSGSEKFSVDLGFALAGRAYPDDIKNGTATVEVSIATTAAEFENGNQNREQREASAKSFRSSMPKIPNCSLTSGDVATISGFLPSNAEELSHAIKTKSFTFTSYLANASAAAARFAGVYNEMSENEEHYPSASAVLSVIGHSARVSVANGLQGCGITGRSTIICQEGAEPGDEIFKFSGAYEINENNAYGGQKPLTGARQLSAGTSHVCAATGSGEVSCWGSNAHGALGTDELPLGAFSSNTAYKTKLAGLSGTLSISSEAHLTCASAANGEKVCWGEK